MKKLIATLLFAFTVSFFVSPEAIAQRYDENEYHYSDIKTGTIYQLYLRFKGYQVEVFVKNNKQTQWTTCTVTASSDKTISYKVGATQYHAQLDPNNDDAVVVWDANYQNKWKYFKKQ